MVAQKVMKSGPDHEPAEGIDLHPERTEVLQQVKPSIQQQEYIS